MNVNDKIKQILIDKGLTPSYFADEIGVQRSSISHILSGRNRPSFDIIQKVIRRFPDLGYDWIMEDDLPNPVASPDGATQTVAASPRVSPRDRFNPVNAKPASSMSIPETKPAEMAKAVERILIFYSDGTFREYSPSS